MARKILFLCGSPRTQGNTRTVVDWAADGAKNAGAEVEIVDCSSLENKVVGCTACMGCKNGSFRCVIKDEVSALVARVEEFDVIVFASPVYFFSSTAQLKAVVDRMFSLIHHDPEKGTLEHRFVGKELAAIGTAGGDVGSGLNAFELTFKTMAGFLQLEFNSLLIPFAPLNPEEISGDAEVKQQAVEFGAKLGA